MRIFFFTCFVLIAAAPATALDIQTLNECAALSDDEARLACFDNALADAEETDAGSGSETMEAEQPVDSSAWDVTTEISRIDDSTKVFLTTPALEINRGRFGNGVRFVMLIACRENSTNLWFHFGGFFMSDYQHGRITYRIDDQPAQTKRFRESNNNEALGLWSGNTAIPFIKSLFGAERLFIRATPHSESAVEAEFDIAGLESVIEPLRDACNW